MQKKYFSTIKTIVLALVRYPEEISGQAAVNVIYYNFFARAVHFDIVLTGFGCSTIRAMVQQFLLEVKMKKVITILMVCFFLTPVLAAWQFNLKLSNIREIQLNNNSNNGTRAITFVGDNASGNPVTCWVDYTGDIGKANLALLLSIKANTGVLYFGFENSESNSAFSVPTRTLATAQTNMYQHIYFIATE